MIDAKKIQQYDNDKVALNKLREEMNKEPKIEKFNKESAAYKINFNSLKKETELVEKLGKEILEIEQQQKFREYEKFIQDIKKIDDVEKLETLVKDLENVLGDLNKLEKTLDSNIKRIDSSNNQRIKLAKRMAEFQKEVGKLKEGFALVYAKKYKEKADSLKESIDTFEKDKAHSKIISQYKKLKKENKGRAVYNLLEKDDKSCICGIGLQPDGKKQLDATLEKNNYAFCSNCGRILIELK